MFLTQWVSLYSDRGSLHVCYPWQMKKWWSNHWHLTHGIPLNVHKIPLCKRSVACLIKLIVMTLGRNPEFNHKVALTTYTQGQLLTKAKEMGRRFTLGWALNSIPAAWAVTSHVNGSHTFFHLTETVLFNYGLPQHGCILKSRKCWFIFYTYLCTYLNIVPILTVRTHVDLCAMDMCTAAVLQLCQELWRSRLLQDPYHTYFSHPWQRHVAFLSPQPALFSKGKLTMGAKYRPIDLFEERFRHW